MSLTYLIATEIVEKIRNRTISVEAVATAFLDRIEAFNPIVNAVVSLRDRKEILAEAREKDHAVSAGQAAAQLLGLPMTVKDTFAVKGLVNSCGHPFYKRHVAQEDAELIRRLKKAGVIILGKTNLPLFSFDWQATNPWFGTTNNPYDTAKVPGGSSGDSAASVATGFSPLELGSDAGGSIRVPASFCGVCGLRPTENALSNRGNGRLPGQPLGGRRITVPGPFAKNMQDLDLLLRVLWTPEDLHAEIPPVPYASSGWTGEPLRIAYSETINQIDLQSEYAALFSQFIDRLKNGPHQVVNRGVDFDEKKAYRTHTTLFGAELDSNLPLFLPFKKLGVYSYFYYRFRDHEMAKGLSRGIRLPPRKFAQALDYKDYLSDIYTSFFKDHDIWITPVCATLPFDHQRTGKPFRINGRRVRYTDALGKFTFTTALSGYPILVIPIGMTEAGLPAGVQIHARKWQDKRLVDIGKYLESLTPGFQRPGAGSGER